MLNDDASRPVAVVTGASRGVGLGIARHLIRRDFEALSISRTPPPEDSRVTHVPADLTKSESLVAAFDYINSQYQRIDVLINNAAVLNSQYLMIMPSRSIESMMDTNLTGAIIATREAIRIMRKNRYGRVINISSMATVLKPKGDSVYAATKSALEMFSSIIAKELFPLGITSNVLSVSAYDTDMFRSLNSEKIRSILDSLPVPGLVDLSQITDIVDYLLSPSGVNITGQVIRLGGVA